MASLRALALFVGAVVGAGFPLHASAQSTKTTCDYGSTVRRGTVECTTRTVPDYTSPWSGLADAFSFWAQAQEQQNQHEAYLEYLRQQTALLEAQNQAIMEAQARGPTATLTAEQISTLPSTTLTDDAIYGANRELKVLGLVELIRRIGPEFYPDWTSDELWTTVANYGDQLEKLGIDDLPIGSLLRGFVHFANAEYKK